MDSRGTSLRLPLELYTEAFAFLYIFEGESGLQTILSLLSTSRPIRAAASPNAIWRPYYRARYTHSVESLEDQRKAQYRGNYRLQYFARRERDRQALRLLDEIRAQPTGRGVRACTLAKEFSFDVWDALRLETQLPVPAYFREPGDSEQPAAPNALSRRYWAAAVQGVIARHWAVRTWRLVQIGDPSVSFEQMMAAFSAFFDRSPKEICKRLDNAGETCRVFLEEQGVELDEEHEDFSLEEVCRGVVSFMQTEGWMADEDAENVGSNNTLLRAFPHAILENGGRDGPLKVLSKTWIFMVLCNHLGIDAFPTRLQPKETVCCVQSLNISLPLIVNFRRGARLITRGPEECGGHSRTEGDVPAHAGPLALVPLHASAFFMEAGFNAFLDLQIWTDNLHAGPQRVNTITDDYRRVVHATQCAQVVAFQIIRPEGAASTYFPEDMAEALPLDGEAIIMDALFANGADVTPPYEKVVEGLQGLLHRMEHPDVMVVQTQPQGPHVPTRRHFVGEILRDTVTGEYGCVIGWQYERSASNGTNEHDKSHIRIRVLSPHFVESFREPADRFESAALTKEAARSFHQLWRHFGRYFEDVSLEGMKEDEHGEMLPTRLVLTAEMQARYPDDVRVHLSS